MRALHLNSTVLTHAFRSQAHCRLVLVLLAILALCGCGGSKKTLFEAIQDRDFPAVKRLLRADPQSARRADPHGATPLHYTALWGYDELTELLLAKGAEVNATQKQGGTPLHWATTCGHAAVVKVLLAHGSDVHARMASGKTPLHTAVSISEQFEPSREVVVLLLDHGADINARDERGWTPLYWAAVMQHRTIARFLIARGADYDVFVAAALGDTNRLAELLQRQPDLACSTTLAGLTPLHLAANKGELHSVEMLLDVGADVNAADRTGDTPLHATADGNHLDVAGFLLAHDANPMVRNHDGETAGERALSNQSAEMAQLLDPGIASQ